MVSEQFVLLARTMYVSVFDGQDTLKSLIFPLNMSELEAYAGADALTRDIGDIILINVCMEQIMYGDYFVGNPRHTIYIDRKNGREWRTIN